MTPAPGHRSLRDDTGSATTENIVYSGCFLLLAAAVTSMLRVKTGHSLGESLLTAAAVSASIALAAIVGARWINHRDLRQHRAMLRHPEGHDITSLTQAVLEVFNHDPRVRRAGCRRRFLRTHTNEWPVPAQHAFRIALNHPQIYADNKPGTHTPITLWRGLTADSDFLIICLQAGITEAELAAHFDGTSPLNPETVHLLSALRAHN